MRDQSWRDDAACANTDPNLFVLESGESTLPAKRICATCDVAQQCLDYALATRQRGGVWGGLSHTERAKLLQAGVA